jgi:hypothetical protein
VITILCIARVAPSTVVEKPSSSSAGIKKFQLLITGRKAVGISGVDENLILTS